MTRPTLWLATFVSGAILACASAGAQAAVLFSDDFNRTASNTVGNGWVELENDSDDVAIVSGGVTGNALRLRDELPGNPDAAASQFAIDTTGYTTVRLSFQYAVYNPSATGSSDRLYVAYTLDGSTWNSYTSYTLGGSGAWSGVISFELPAGAGNNSNFGIRFWTDVSEYNEGALIDNVVVDAFSWCAIFEDTFDGRGTGNDVGNGWQEIEKDADDVRLYGGYGVSGSNGMLLKDTQSGIDAAAAQMSISTIGASTVRISYYWRMYYPSYSDNLYVDYTINGGTTWSNVAQHGGSDTTLDQYTVFLPSSAANQASVGIRFRIEVNNSYSGAFVDNVVVQGDSCGPPPDTTPPTFTFDATPEPQTFNGDVTLNATATDTSGIAAVEYKVQYEQDAAYSAYAPMNPAGGNSWTKTLTAPFVGTHSACGRATDASANANTTESCDEFVVNPVQLSVAFNGEELDLNGAPTFLKASVSGGPSACYNGKLLRFVVTSDTAGGLYGTTGVVFPTPVASDGKATAEVNLPLGHLYEVDVEFDNQDLGGTSAAECLGASDTSNILMVADPNASSTGGGWYFVDLGPGNKYRLNFGYTAQRKYNRKADEWFTTGNVLWISRGAYKLKGKITEGGKLPSCDADFAACAAFGGDGVLYERNPDYSAYYCSLGQTYRCIEWSNPQPVHFTFFANDGGSSMVCETLNKKGKQTCKESLKPDAFGMQLDLVTLSEESIPLLMNGGNLVVR